jgi:flavin reductase (DIM6/NTAB) family NADH-FMN oxidoreductase RutF
MQRTNFASDEMKIIDPRDTTVQQFHSYLLGAVTPRPIAFVSTIDKEGKVNLSPFSFFNCFGANPPILVFSPSRRVRDNTTKHSYENVKEVPEAVVHIVNYDLVQQMSLASTEYPKGVNEFVKAGLTEVPSTKVRPPRVKECPVAMECKVIQIIETGTGPGAGNLIICEVLLMHVSESVLVDGKIDPFKLDAVSRLGGDYYARINSPVVFTVPKPIDKLGIGIDQLPESIRNSKILTGNDLGRLANVEAVPLETHLGVDLREDVRQAMEEGGDAIHQLAQHLLRLNRTNEAWQVLLRGI